MQEETTSSGETQQQSLNDIKHVYYEVGREILSKPNLLCDIVETLETYPVLIYCNTPSDTDFVEVMLKKRGINSQKLIGNVPQEKIDATFDLISKKQLSAIVLTDIAARLIDVTPFTVAINYSPPQDGDIYSERATKGNTLKRLLTLVAPLELANFHFAKKALFIEPELNPSPSPESIAKARMANLKSQVANEEQSKNETLTAMAKVILLDSDAEKVVAFLLHNTLTALPAAKAIQAKAETQDSDDDFDDRQDRGGDRWNSRGGNSGGGRSNNNRYDRNDRGGDRNDRGGDRGGDRNDRGGDRNDRNNRNDRNDRNDRGDNYRSRERFDNNDNSDNRRKSYDNQEPGDEVDAHAEMQRGERRSRQNGRNNYERQERQIKKDARIYLGQGSEEGVSKEQILELLNKHGVSPDGLKHLSIRKNYAFFDIDDEKSAEIVEDIKNTDAKKTAVKAITINAVSTEQPEAENSGEGEGKSNNEESFQDESFVEADETENIGNR